MNEWDTAELIYHIELWLIHMTISLLLTLSELLL